MAYYIGSYFIKNPEAKATLAQLRECEDIYLSKVAEEIDKKGAKTYSHEAAWE